MLSFTQRHLLCAALFAASVPATLLAQDASPAAATHAAGTVQGISGSVITLKTDGGQQYTVQVADSAKLLQVPPDSKNLSAAQPFALTAIAAGDRILVNGNAPEPTVINASRIILMKSTAIASLHASEQDDWRKRGMGGLVKSVDMSGQIIQITSNGRPVTIKLQRTTILRRYAADSVAFESAVPGILAQIQPGDQLRVRGDRSPDGSTITADEIVSGSFRNIAGPITAIDPMANTITVRDLTTKNSILVHATSGTSLRKLDANASANAAAFLARRANGGGNTASGAASAGTPPATAAGRPHVDIAQVIQRMSAPITLTDLHVNDAVMIVASAPDTAATSVTAITVLGGVEQILSATPKGSQVMTLSPWSLGGGAGEGGDMGGGTP